MTALIQWRIEFEAVKYPIKFNTRTEATFKMRFHSQFICIALLFQSLALNAQDENYKLVWSDEFTKKGKPDTSKWDYEKGFVRNEELQWYQPENAYCKKGLLIIEAKKEKRSNPDYVNGSKDWRKSRSDIQYTSACLITRKKKDWLYGRFEMRARIDISAGMWPA